MEEPKELVPMKATPPPSSLVLTVKYEGSHTYVTPSTDSWSTVPCKAACCKYRTHDCPVYHFAGSNGYERYGMTTIGKCVSFYLDELVDTKEQPKPYKLSHNLPTDTLLIVIGDQPTELPSKRPEPLATQPQGLKCPACGATEGLIQTKRHHRGNKTYTYYYMAHKDFTEKNNRRICYLGGIDKLPFLLRQKLRGDPNARA